MVISTLDSRRYRCITFNFRLEKAFAGYWLRLQQIFCMLCLFAVNNFFFVSLLQGWVHAASMSLVLNLLVLNFVVHAVQVVWVSIVGLDLAFYHISWLHNQIKQERFGLGFILCHLQLLHFFFASRDNVVSLLTKFAEWHHLLDVIPRGAIFLQSQE